MIIAIVQSRVTGKWGYCPKAALAILGRVIEYDNDQNTAATADDAIAQARADESVPSSARFEIVK